MTGWEGRAVSHLLISLVQSQLNFGPSSNWQLYFVRFAACDTGRVQSFLHTGSKSTWCTNKIELSHSFRYKDLNFSVQRPYIHLGIKTILLHLKIDSLLIALWENKCSLYQGDSSNAWMWSLSSSLQYAPFSCIDTPTPLWLEHLLLNEP